ncbi:MAG: rod shape-determining protein RodA [Armatimonadetes bacterium]|nr:rod shape-determining protein RodA [Armatimonadota bacterium]
MLTVVVTIILYGVFAIYSAAPSKYVASYVQKQIATGIVGLVFLTLAASLDDHILPRLSRWVYWATVAALLFVDIAGRHSKGAQRWLDLGPLQLQPSEPAKVVLIVTLAAFFLSHYDEIRELRTFILSLVHVALPLFLVFKQPDLGTSLVLASIWIGVSLAAGVRWKYMLALAAMGVVGFFILWNTNVFQDYQKKRVVTLMHPEADAQGAGYHVKQSKIAIGSGQLLGKGYRHGTQSQYAFIPEQHTDFIFTVVGEELGFVGSAALIILYWILIARVAMIMQATEETLGRMMAGGVLAMLLFHVVMNIGMTMGIMPVVGVPLPFFSYGPSSLLSMLTAMGLVMGVYRRRHRIAF